MSKGIQLDWREHMNMNDNLKDFIENNIELIEENKWEEVYELGLSDISLDSQDIGQFSMTMLSADIHPENHMKHLPDFFLFETSVHGFDIPNSIVAIGDSVFAGCQKLKSITIPNSIVSIGRYAFFNCSRLTGVTIPDSVASIGSKAFEYCTRLKSIKIPDNVTSIGDSAFDNCDSLTDVTIGSGVNIISNAMFNNCSKLQTVNITSNILSIHNYAFARCSSNLTINYSGTKEQWKNVLWKPEAFFETNFKINCIDGTII